MKTATAEKLVLYCDGNEPRTGTRCTRRASTAIIGALGQIDSNFRTQCSKNAVIRNKAAHCLHLYTLGMQ